MCDVQDRLSRESPPLIAPGRPDKPPRKGFMDFFNTSVWYKELAPWTFPTLFLELSQEQQEALAAGKITDPEARKAVHALRPLMKEISGNAFVAVDCCAPTDTERFENKRGAVYSADSAWKYLALSAKVRAAAAAGQVQNIVIRPFRRMSQPREFRLFIENRRLMAMSQYHLVRHFRRLEGRKEFFWTEAQKLINATLASKLPEGRFSMDIYFTASNEILIIDLNAWRTGSPLLFRTWDREWSEDDGIRLMPPPVKLSGEVKVSF